MKVMKLPATSLIVICAISALPVSALPKDTAQYVSGVSLTVPFPEAQVAQVVLDVSQNGIIRGSKEYEKDEYINGAADATNSKLFPEWTGGGKVFYKIRAKAISPRNFKDSNDVGTLAVRYIVQSAGDNAAALRIDAVFVEDFHRTVHSSNGSVEGAEYKNIHDRLETMASMKAQAVELEKQRQTGVPEISSSKDGSEVEYLAPPIPGPARAAVAEPVRNTSAVPQSLEDHVKDLRHQVERLVKSPGAQLKSAPFRTATSLASVAEGTQVLVVISTPYWFGIETRDGQHGWIDRDQLELLP